MTRVCVECGWLVLEGERCRRDGGLSVSWKIAAKACRVHTLRALLNLEPRARLLGFAAALYRIRAAAE